MSLAATVGQLLDKVSDLIVGPVQGTVLATAKDLSVVVPQGLQASLPDGRLIRVTKGKRVTTAATAVSVRLLYLAPTVPVAANFAAVAGGLTATWQAGTGADGPVAVPDNLTATGTTTAFGFTARAAPLRIASFVESTDVRDPEDLFKAGAIGGVSLVLTDPEVKTISGGGIVDISESRIMLREVVWKIRANIATNAPSKERRIKARDVHDNLCAVLLGATVGDSQLRLGPWKLVRRDPNADSWELTIITQLWTDGRVLQLEAVDGLPDFEDLDALITVPGDTDQPGPFRVETINKTTNAFDNGFNEGFA